jgi:hypothetical protein
VELIKKRYSKDRRKFFVDEQIFKTIDTEEKAYWLGFLYADGSNNKTTLSVGLQKSDEPHLLKLKSFLKSTYKLYNTTSTCSATKTHGKKYNVITLRIRSEAVCRDLDKLGCHRRKSGNLRFPIEEQVPLKFTSAFLRGFFDGDGCVTFVNRRNKTEYSCNFTLTKEMGEGIGKILASLKISYFLKPVNGKVNYWRLHINGNRQCVTFLHYLYNNATIFLTRKYQRFLNLIKYFKDGAKNNTLRLKENCEVPKSTILNKEIHIILNNYA